MLSDDPLWYKDAIIYECHVRAFHDGIGDGVGDFRGLAQKVDYLQDLGIESYLGVALTGSSGQPLGILSVMSRSAMTSVSSPEAILRIFASRVSSELERRRAERALRESESRNSAILGALPDLIFVSDRMGIIESVYAKDAGGLPSAATR